MDKKTIESLGYFNAKEMPEVGWCGLVKNAFTTGLYVDISEYGSEGRYCYEHWNEAKQALNEWDGAGDPPGNWIKAKFFGKKDRHGPGSNVPLEFRN